jgi:hypothetical protein
MKNVLLNVGKVLLLGGGFYFTSLGMAMMAMASQVAPTNLEECLAAAQRSDGTITPQATRTCAFNFSLNGKYYEMGHEVAQVLNRDEAFPLGTTVPDTSHLETSI